MRFQYQGTTRQKEPVTGVVEAVDEIEARMKLRAMQIRPDKIGIAASKGFDLNLKKLLTFGLGGSINVKSLMLFTKQFSSLLDSGVPVVQCLDILGQQEQRANFKRILTTIKNDVEAGGGLADSLAKHPSAFSDFFVRVVEAGEVSGTLDKSVRRIGVQLEKLGKIRSKVAGALLYPIITVVVATFVLAFLLVKVIPEVSKLYGDSSSDLPEITQFVLALSEWFQEYVGALLVGIFCAGVGFGLLLRMPSFREVWDRFIVRVPLFGSLIRRSSIARFTRTLATLVSSGVPLLNCFEICVRLTSNFAVRDILKKTSLAVQEGKSIAQGLAMGGDLFPPMVIHMVNIGEMSGKLDELLNKVADIYDDEVDDAVNALTGMLQPALIVVVGIIIAFLLISMYMPIFSLAEKVTGG